VETATLTGWATVIIAVPAVLALARAHAGGPAFYVHAALLLVGLAVFTAALATLLTTGAATVLRRFPTRVAAAVVVIVLVGGFVSLVGGQLVPSTADFHTMFEPGLMNGKPASIKFIEARFRAWPTHPYAAALYAAATGGAAGSPTTDALTALAPLVMLVMVALLGRRLFAATLPAIAEGFALGVRARATAPTRRFPRRLSGPVGAMVEREVLGIARNPHELGRAALLVLLLLLYSLFIGLAPLRDVRALPGATARLTMLNVLAAGYFLTAFALRFGFPSVSLEGRVAWLLLSSPLDLRRLLLAKLVLHAGALTVVVLPVALGGAIRLGGGPALVAATAALLVLIAATAATLSLAFGAAWPDFHEPNAEALSTSGAGLTGSLVCLAYVGVMGWLAHTVAGGGGVAGPLALAAALSLALVVGALARATRRLPRLEAP
jgi:ABC-2 type transport system permease protein